MIEVKNLSKSYRDRAAISGISFSVGKGEILGFLGPNGAGKSTTMKILSGLLQCDSGTSSVNGFDLRTDPRSAKASIGYLPETPPVYMNMEVADYLAFTAALHHVPRRGIKAAVDLALERCDLASVQRRIIGNLSKGFRQRVGLAQAIVHNPPVLILDEPTVGLDPKQIIEIRELIRGFAGTHTVILSTHILPEVKATCDRVVVIDRGKIVAADSLEGITARAVSEQRIGVLLGADPSAALEKLRRLEGIANVESVADASGHFRLWIKTKGGRELRAEIAEMLVAAKLGLLELSREETSLEDAFMKLVSHEELEVKHAP